MKVSFKSTLASSYYISGTTITHTNTYKDLGLVISENLSWTDHYDNIIARAYKILGLIRRTFSIFHYPSAKIKLYTSLVRSQLTYCTQLWRPYLIKDILNIERVQRRATKFILNDYDSDYKSRLLQLKLLPQMYFFELQDICFTIKSLKSPTKNFNIRDYISFSNINTRSSSCNKLIHIFHSSNLNRYFFFHRIPRLWNSIPIIDLSLSLSTIKSKLKRHFWNHFIEHFNPDDHCTLHYLCPCNKCYLLPPPANFWILYFLYNYM